MSVENFAIAGLGLMVVLSMWSADHSKQLKNQALKDNAVLVARVDELDAAALRQTSLLAVLSHMNQKLNQTQSTLSVQTSQISRSLAELKRNDEKITTYLADPVPGAIGLRYARTETTDPVEYRSSAAGVRTDIVPSAGPPGPARE